MLESLHRAAEIVRGADAIVIAAGAGLGVDSGLPDFRGSEGFWRAYPALAAANMSFTEVASPSTFRSDPALAWGFYGHRLQLYRKTTPHGGFAILKRWADSAPMGFWIFTSNVDGQFQRGGFNETRATECHGSIHHLQCLNSCTKTIWSADIFEPEIDIQRCRLLNEPPRCPNCGSMARPNIMMFNDYGWLPTRTDEQSAREHAWLRTVDHYRPNLAVIELGAGTAIPSVRMFSERMVHEYGARIVRINPREPVTYERHGIGLAMGAMQALARIDEQL